MKYKAIVACGAVTALLGVTVSVKAQPASINGAYDLAFGAPITVQTDATGFGQTYNELDAGYGLVASGNLYLFLSGNLQNNGNNINIFIAGPGGQSILNAANPGIGFNNLSAMNGSQFSSGFLAIYGFNVFNSGTTLNVSQYNLLNHTAVDTLGSLTTSGNIVANGIVDNSVVVGFNDNNEATQAANVGPGSLGLELAIPLSLLGNPSGPIEVLADINGNFSGVPATDPSAGFLSNQFLAGLPGGTGNLGDNGIFNFSSTAGEYFTVPVPEPSGLALFGLSGLTLPAIRRRKYWLNLIKPSRKQGFIVLKTWVGSKLKTNSVYGPSYPHFYCPLRLAV